MQVWFQNSKVKYGGIFFLVIIIENLISREEDKHKQRDKKHDEAEPEHKLMMYV